MSACDCYMMAVRYLAQARACDDDVTRALLVETAKTWRNLADRTKSGEASGSEVSGTMSRRTSISAIHRFSGRKASRVKPQ
jgi:hypothetical protein